MLDKPLISFDYAIKYLLRNKGEFDENVLNYNTTPRKSLGNFAMLAGINVKTLQEWHLAVYSDAYK